MLLLFRALFLALGSLCLSTDHDIFHDNSDISIDSDVGKDMEALVKLRGYPIERHQAITPDGYILSIFRLKMHQNQHGRPPVVLQHGLLDSSYTWVNNLKHQSLGYILADQGFDVWLGNSRGNKYGRAHTKLNPDVDREFWNFTWQDMAEYDLPTIVNYVLEITSSDTLSFVAHSQGSTQFLAAASSSSSSSTSNSKYLSKVNIFIALAPVAYVSNARSQLLRLLAQQEAVKKILGTHVLHEFLPDSSGLDALAPELCAVSPDACQLIIEQICGPSTSLNKSRIQVYVSETPAGTSLKNIHHWIQGINSETFRKYDYGSDDANSAVYGSHHLHQPPRYNLADLSVPTALFYGGNDYLADADTDVQRILTEAPPDKIVYTHRTDKYSHLDFVWATDAHSEVYPHVVALLRKYATRKRDEL